MNPHIRVHTSSIFGDGSKSIPLTLLIESDEAFFSDGSQSSLFDLPELAAKYLAGDRFGQVVHHLDDAGTLVRSQTLLAECDENGSLRVTISPEVLPMRSESDRAGGEVEWVWRPSAHSRSPLHPILRITTETGELFVDLAGAVYDTLPDTHA